MSTLTYTYLTAKEAPRREDRLNACNALGTDTCDLCGKRESGCLKHAARSFMQTQGCQLYLSSSIINTILNSVIIINAPLGCGSANILAAGTTRVVQRQRDPRAGGLIWLNTNLDATDVITGGERKLIEAIRYADRTFRPKSIIVANTCVPGIIGDDIDNIAINLQDEIVAGIIPVHCEGFKSKIMATAYDSVYHGIMRTMLEKQFQRPDPVIIDEVEEFKEKLRINRTVNVFNVSSMSRADELELTRLLSALDLNVQMYPCYAQPDNFAYVDEAALNVSVCSTHDDYFGGHLKNIYGTPYISNTIPVGTKPTRQWILAIAEFFNLQKQAEALIAYEEARLKKALLPYREALAGKRVYLAGGEIRALAMAQYLQDDLGMEILTIQGYHYDEFADSLLKEMGDEEKRKFSAATGQPFEQANILKKTNPDIYIGHVGINGWAGRAGFPVFPLWMVSVNYMGYSGAFEIARRILRVLKNPSFNRNLAQHIPLPYRQEWYSRDPYTYIKDDARQDTSLV
jgi:nitrogenase molybdenum-iron protein alpha chain